MRCDKCDVPMEQIAPGLLECPSCRVTTELWDAGYQPRSIRLVEEETPFRASDIAAEAETTVRRAAKQKIKPIPPRICLWPPCSVEFVPTHPHQEYHELPCQQLAKAARDKARRDAERQERRHLRAAS